MNPPHDLLAVFLAAIEAAAERGAARALAAHAAPVESTPAVRATLDELARLESCSRATIRRLVAEGAPVTYLGQSPRFDVEAFRAYLAERGRRGTQAAPSKREAIPGSVRLLSRRTR